MKNAFIFFFLSAAISERKLVWTSLHVRKQRHAHMHNFVTGMWNLQLNTRSECLSIELFLGRDTTLEIGISRLGYEIGISRLDTASWSNIALWSDYLKAINSLTTTLLVYGHSFFQCTKNNISVHKFFN